jgi:hypothetical protein
MKSLINLYEVKSDKLKDILKSFGYSEEKTDYTDKVLFRKDIGSGLESNVFYDDKFLTISVNYGNGNGSSSFLQSKPDELKKITKALKKVDAEA